MRKIKRIGKETITATIPVYNYEGIEYRHAIVEGDTIYIEGNPVARHLELATKNNLNELGLNILHVGLLLREK